jgi:mono/diheme cytochrome c family protein
MGAGTFTFTFTFTGRLAVGALALAALAGCRGQTSKETPIVGIRNMYDQPKYSIQSESDFFDDGRTMRMPISDTVSREREIDIRFSEGRTEDNTAWLLAVPEPMVKRNNGLDKMVARGQDRFNIYCAPCHDKTGSGHGMVQKRAVASGATAFAPPTFHQDRIRHMPDGQLFATISNGKGNMPAYGPQIPIEDRWAIVTYVRALQVSQAKTESNL